MFNVQLSYKPPIYCRILFQSRGRPRQFIGMKILRALVVPGGGFREGVVLQGKQLPSGLPVIVQS